MFDTRELRDAYKNRRDTLVEAAAEAGVPFSAYLDAEYDPEKDGELGVDDERVVGNGCRFRRSGHDHRM